MNETLNTLRAQNILLNIQALCDSFAERLDALELSFRQGKTTACNAKKEYRRIIERANFYGDLSFRVANKYFNESGIISGDCKYFKISDFSHYISFFEL